MKYGLDNSARRRCCREVSSPSDLSHNSNRALLRRRLTYLDRGKLSPQGGRSQTGVSRGPRRGGRVVECTGLETGVLAGHVGSNPTLPPTVNVCPNSSDLVGRRRVTTRDYTNAISLDLA